MKYTCICKKDFQTEHIYINGNSTWNSVAKYGNQNTHIYITEQGSQCEVFIKPNEYIVTQTIEDKTYEFSMDRECFREHFSMRNFIRNKKLESLGI